MSAVDSTLRENAALSHKKAKYCLVREYLIPSRNHKVIFGSRRLQPAHAQVENLCHYLNANLYENSSVGRASVQWGGRPRPPTDMAARDGRPTNTSHFPSFVVSVRK